MEKSPREWVYSALVGMSLLMAGWLWQIVSVLRDDVHRIQENKADKSQVEQKAADRWTGSQQAEYRQYVDTRFDTLETEINRYHRTAPAGGGCK